MGALLFGSLLPDIDHEKSTLGRMVYPLASFINRLSPHRGATHSLLALFAVLAAGMAYLPVAVAMAMGIGYGSHLLGDLFFGKGGCPLLWPLRGKIRMPWARLTGGFGEQVFAVSLFAIMVIGALGFLDGAKDAILAQKSQMGMAIEKVAKQFAR
jgi:inner membrane protein